MAVVSGVVRAHEIALRTFHLLVEHHDRGFEVPQEFRVVLTAPVCRQDDAGHLLGFQPLQQGPFEVCFAR